MDEHVPPQIPAPEDQSPQPSPGSGSKRLYRSDDKKLFMGVCGGLAEYFDFDPVLIRVLFVAGTLIGGASVVLYVVLALIMPAESMLDAQPRVAARSTVDEVTTALQRAVDQIADELRRAFGRRNSGSGDTQDRQS